MNVSLTCSIQYITRNIWGWIKSKWCDNWKWFEKRKCIQIAILPLCHTCETLKWNFCCLSRFKPSPVRARKLCQSSVRQTIVVFLQPESSSCSVARLEGTSFVDWLGPCQREMRKQQIGWRWPRHRTEERGHSQCPQFAVAEKCGVCELQVDDCQRPEMFYTQWLGRPWCAQEWLPHCMSRSCWEWRG